MVTIDANCCNYLLRLLCLSLRISHMPHYCPSCEKPLTGGKKYCNDKCELSTQRVLARINGPHAAIIPAPAQPRKTMSKYEAERARIDARDVMSRYTNKRRCIVCGSHHRIEVHHKKPVRTFPIGTPHSVINDRKNLVYLCSQHHHDVEAGRINLAF